MDNDFVLDVVGWVMGWTVAQLIDRGTSAEANMQGGADEARSTALESSMQNVIPFQARTAPQVPSITSIDATALLWIPLAELREKLWGWDSIKRDTPDLMRQVVKLGADSLLEDATTYTDADARKWGWADVAAMRERGQDMLLILAEHVPQNHG